MVFRLSFLLLILLLKTTLIFSSDDVLVRGQVKGLISGGNKTTAVVLSEVTVAVETDGKITDVKSNAAGIYTLILQKNKRYLMTVSRNGYHFKSLYINTHNLPGVKNNSRIELSGLDFLLLKKEVFPDDISSFEDMGQISYDANLKKFNLNTNPDYSKKKLAEDHSLRLLGKTTTYIEEAEIETEGTVAAEMAVEQHQAVESNSAQIAVEEKILEEKLSLDQVSYASLDEIKDRRIILDSARSDLERLRKNARTREDSLIVAKLEAQLLAFEIDLKLAEETILNQQDQIILQQRMIRLYIFLAILLVIVIAVVFWFYRDKSRTNKILAYKNKLILDGIHYANTIQNSFLKNEAEIQKMLPEFTMLFRPRDIVSGDIYWVSEVEGKTVIAAVDCTGHGVPGAFISMIANTLLNEIVKNRKILDPGKILGELHKGVMEVLQQDAEGRQSQDGMDMSLMVVDKKQKQIEFGGARNHLYRVSGEEVEIIKADVNSIGGRSLRSSDGFKKNFNTRQVVFDEDSVYYLFSDGFMDQFGGPENEKFNMVNFKKLLVECSPMSVQKQKEKLQNTFEEWKGNNQQLDDVLVLGVRLKF